MKLKFVAFNGKSLSSKLIRFWTRSEWYSHIAFLHPNGKLIEAWGDKLTWKWSSFAAHTPGTDYEIWELEVDEQCFFFVVSIFETWAKQNLPYDRLGIIGFVFQPVRDSEKGKFCSEGFIWPFVEWFNWDRVKPPRVSPQGAVEIMQAKGAVRIETGSTSLKDVS